MTRRVIYPSVVQPLGVSFLTVPLTWFQPLATPTRRAGLITALAVAAAVLPPPQQGEQTFVTKYQQALSEPVRVKPGLGAHQQAAFVIDPRALTQKETTSPDRYMQALSEPVRFRTAQQQRDFTISTFGLAQPETTTPDKYMQALSEPVRPIKLRLSQDTAYLALDDSAKISIGWFNPFADVVRGKVPYQQPFTVDPFALTQPESTLVSKWFSGLSEPVRYKWFGPSLQSTTASPPFGIALSEDIHVQWMTPLSEPVRYRWFGAAYQLSFAISAQAETQPETVHTQWWNPLSEPVRVKPAAQQQRDFTTSAFGMVQPETTTPDKWFEPLSTPVWKKFWFQFPEFTFVPVQVLQPFMSMGWYGGLNEPVRFRVAQQQLAFTISAQAETQPETTSPDKYYQALSEPVRVKPGLPAFEQLAFTTAQTALSFDRWFQALSDPMRLVPRAQQQAFFPVPLVTDKVFADRWFEMLSEPVRYRWFGAAGQPAAVMPAFVPPIAFPDGYMQALSEPVRYRWFHADQQMNFIMGQPSIVLTLMVSPGRTVKLEKRAWNFVLFPQSLPTSAT